MGRPFNEVLEKFVLSAEEAIPLMVDLLKVLVIHHAGGQRYTELMTSNVTLLPNGSLHIIGATSPGTPETDLWAAGAIFYEMMTGQQPKTVGAIQYPIETLHWCPMPVRDVIAKLCDGRLEERFSKAEEAIRALEAVQKKKPDHFPALVNALSSHVSNAAETMLLLSRQNSKLNTKRAFTIAACMQVRAAGGVPSAALTISPETAQAALHQMRGEPMKAPAPSSGSATNTGSIKIFETREPESHGRGFPFAPVMIVALAAAGIWFAMGRPKLALPFLGGANKPSAEQARAALPQLPHAMPTHPPVFWLHAGKAPLLSWDKSLEKNDAFLQVATSANFQMMSVDVPVKGTQHQITRELEEGRYFWRLWDRATNRAVGPFQFTLAFVEPPRLLFPTGDQTFAINRTYTKAEFEVSWQCKTAATEYEAVITGRDGHAVLATKRADCLWPVQLARGEYELKLRVSRPVGEMNNWTQPVKFWVRGGAIDSLSKFRGSEKVKSRQPAAEKEDGRKRGRGRKRR